MLQIAIDSPVVAHARLPLRLIRFVLGVTTALVLAACTTARAPENAVLTTKTGEQAALAPKLSPTASVFPLSAYDQRVDYWVPPQAPGYERPLLEEAQQQQALDDLRDRFFGGTDGGAGDAPHHGQSRASSPWNRAFIETENTGDNRRRMLAGIEWNLQRFGPNGPQQGYGPNLRPYPPSWMAGIRRNIDTSQWSGDPSYVATHRAITTGNVSLRLLPTSDPHFYDPRLPGEGYPFDNLQETELRPGTPLYLVGSTRDHGWLYVIAPDVSGWVKDEMIGRVDETFVSRWRAAANDALGAVIAPSLALNDVHGVYHFDAPIGTMLPLERRSDGAGNAPAQRVWLPLLDMQHRAVIGYAMVGEDQVTHMPYRATPAHMAVLLKALQGRPYGWGGTGGYNDCSLELKSLFTPFGIWLPRHSAAQVEGSAMVDLSAQPLQARIDYLTRYGKPFMTIIDIHGHVMLYLGTQLFNGQRVPIVYEDMWGLTPPDASRRAIVGQSVILPLLRSFPEDSELQSQAARPVFRLGFPADEIKASNMSDTDIGPLPPESK